MECSGALHFSLTEVSLPCIGTPHMTRKASKQKHLVSAGRADAPVENCFYVISSPVEERVQSVYQGIIGDTSFDRGFSISRFFGKRP